MPVLSTFKEAVVEYTAGYVVKSTEKAIACTECKLALHAQEERNVKSSVPSLVRCKDRGGLVKPSQCVIKTCTETEKCFQRMAKTVAVPTHPRAMQAVVSSVMPAIIGSTFGCLNVHMFDSEPFNNHVVLMQTSIIQCCCKTRINSVDARHA